MELGQKLRQARLEAGLSQRQLCGDVITRNMLSQIENGASRPSMATLQYLATRLGKPIGFFLEETVPPLPNLPIMEQARQAKGAAVLTALEDYQTPDPAFDQERWLLEALACMDMAKQALREGKHTYARELLEQAKNAGEQTPYYGREWERARLLLLARTGEEAVAVAQALPSLDEELLVHAQAALQENRDAGALLDAVQVRSAQWYCLRGNAYEAAGDYENAVQCYLHAEDQLPKQVYGPLERCYEKLENYKEAYRYACLQR